MPDPVIIAEGLGKRYVIGHRGKRERYLALRDVLARGAGQVFGRVFRTIRGVPLIEGDEQEDFWALRDVSFEVERGEVVGLIGRNGAGKSTLLKVLTRITEPSRGRATIRGRTASLLEVGTGFHPELSGRENIFLNGAILGMRRAEVRAKFDEIVAFAEVERFLDTPVKRYSSGMYVRLAFAVAAHLTPEIVFVDEVLAVGDAAFQKKCLGKLGAVSAEEGKTVLFVSHNMASIRELCSRCLLMEGGRLTASGPTSQLVARYAALAEGDATVDLTTVRQHGPREYARLLRLALSTRDGQPSTAFQMGEPLVAEIDVQILKPVTAVEVGLKISTRFGAAVHYLTSTWEGLAPSLEPGVHTFQVTMEQVLLLPGTYVLGVWVLKGIDWSDVHAQDVATILVTKGLVPPNPNRIDQYVVSGGEVYVPSRWRLIRQREAP